MPQVFQDPEQRPLFLLGSTTHGAFRTHPFSVTHAGHGQCVFGQPQQQEQELGEVLGDCSAAQQPSSTTSSSTGAVRGHHNHTAGTAGRQQQEPGQQLHQQQQQQQQRRERLRVVLASLASLQELQPDVTLSAEALAGQLLVKLTVNCCANPLSALLRCKNGGLNDNPPVQQLQALLVAECKAVFGDALPGTCEELLAHVQHVVSFNASNYNSMLQSVLSGHVTEVEYLNGYVVQQGRRAGVPTPVNELLCTLVQGVEAVPEHYRAAALTPHPTPS
jgi:2-dehydropantoate 2-reductase